MTFAMVIEMQECNETFPFHGHYNHYGADLKNQNSYQIDILRQYPRDVLPVFSCRDCSSTPFHSPLANP